MTELQWPKWHKGWKWIYFKCAIFRKWGSKLQIRSIFRFKLFWYVFQRLHRCLWQMLTAVCVDGKLGMLMANLFIEKVANIIILSTNIYNITIAPMCCTIRLQWCWWLYGPLSVTKIDLAHHLESLLDK